MNEINDRTIYRVRFRKPYKGTETRYYSSETKARQFAKECRRKETLINFSRFDFTIEINF